jgi:hypothetical protein
MIGGRELDSKTVEDVSRVTEAWQENKGTPASAPIDDFQLDTPVHFYKAQLVMRGVNLGIGNCRKREAECEDQAPQQFH